MELSPIAHTEPPVDCPLCPRLVALRRECQAMHPEWWNAPVPAFGDANAWLGIVGLAPGMHGANRTGRPFTGDYAGDLLFATFAKFGLSRGTYQSRIDDGLELEGVIIINSVKCLPPQNKPTPSEINTCRRFLSAQLDALPQRHRLRIAASISASLGSLFLRSSTLAAMIMPGVQKPHCTACSATNACCTGWLRSRLSASIVVT